MSYLSCTRSSSASSVPRGRATRRRAACSSTCRTSTAARTCACSSRTRRRAACVDADAVAAARSSGSPTARTRSTSSSRSTRTRRARTRSTRSTRSSPRSSASAPGLAGGGGAPRASASAAHDTERRCAMSYLKRFGTRRVPQSAPIPGSAQVPNSAGGFAWAVDDWTRLAASCPRLRGRHLLRVGAEADARERAGGRALPRGGRRRARSPRSCA